MEHFEQLNLKLRQEIEGLASNRGALWWEHWWRPRTRQVNVHWLFRACPEPVLGACRLEFVET